MDTDASLPLSKNSLRYQGSNTADNDHKRMYKRSLSMAEAIRQPANLEQPVPLALKVRNAGKVFLKHDQTCQWIKFIQNPESSPSNNKGTPSGKMSANIDPNNSGNKPCLDDAEQTLHQEPSYEERLKSLQRQQEELLVRQHRLQEQLEEQKRQQAQHSDKLEQKSECSEDEPSKSTSRKQMNEKVIRPSPTFRRRLKGRVAQFCADRSEGSLGDVLYYMDYPERRPNYLLTPSCKVISPDRSSDIRPMSVGCGAASIEKLNVSPERTYANSKASSPAALGRQKALFQESGYAVGELLYQHTTPDRDLVKAFEKPVSKLTAVELAMMNKQWKN